VNAQGASNSAGVGHTAPPPGSSGDRVQLTAEQKAALNPLLKFVHQYMKRIAEMYPNVEPHLRTSMSNLVSVYGGRELTKAELSQLLLSFRSDMEQLFGPER